MENIKEVSIHDNKNRKSTFNIELIIYAFALIAYNLISVDTVLEDKIIASIVTEFSLPIYVIILFRLTVAIFTIIISVNLTYLCMSIFLKKVDKIEFISRDLKVLIYKGYFVGMIFNYAILCASTFLIDRPIDLNIISFLAYLLTSVLIGIALIKIIKCKTKYAILLSLLLFVINSYSSIMAIFNAVTN